MMCNLEITVNRTQDIPRVSEKIQAATFHFYKKKFRPSEIYWEIEFVYGEATPTLQTICNWVKKLE
jgi:hypothetical protein